MNNVKHLTNEVDSGSNSDSDSKGKDNKDQETLMHKHGFSALQALNDQSVFQRYLDLIAQFMLNHDDNSKIDFEKDIKALK